MPGWRAISGFDPWEGPYPKRRLERCRWAHGPAARFQIEADTPGPARVVIAGRCYVPDQCLKLVHDGVIVGERPFPPDSGTHRDRLASFNITLREGPNTFDLLPATWQPGPRPMALLVTSISCTSRFTLFPPAPAPHVEPKAARRIGTA